MALNFTVSYTFSPSTTISSSQVNTNTSDVASVFQGLEAETKSLAKLKVDIDPTLALEVATKQYVDHYSTWRRPRIRTASATTVTVEPGLDGTSGDIAILFPDGSIRTETTASHTTFDITRNCSLSGTALSGLRATLSEATNTWYALYAVKVTDTTTTWVTVGDTRLPLQANFAALNTAFGTSGWVYLGMIRNGDNSGTTGDILNFRQCGGMTLFFNTCTGSSLDMHGIRFANTAGATTLTYSETSGTGTTDIPDHLLLCSYDIAATPGTNQAVVIRDSAGLRHFAKIHTGGGSTSVATRFLAEAQAEGVALALSASGAADIFLSGYFDSVLGVGSNPLL